MVLIKRQAKTTIKTVTACIYGYHQNNNNQDQD